MATVERSGPMTPPKDFHLQGVLIRGFRLSGGPEVCIARQSGLDLALLTADPSLFHFLLFCILTVLRTADLFLGDKLLPLLVPGFIPPRIPGKIPISWVPTVIT